MGDSCVTSIMPTIYLVVNQQSIPTNSITLEKIEECRSQAIRAGRENQITEIKRLVRIEVFLSP